MAERNLRVMALGGCGGMGQFAVRTALNFDFVKEIVVADRDGERARVFAETCGPKAVPLQLDVQDEKALSRALGEIDVVLATVGPYYRFGLPILRAAVSAGCDYIDINDDWEPTLEMLDLDNEARRAGITAIVGMGASPGVSNLLAVKAIRSVDEVDTVITGWGAPGEGVRVDCRHPVRAGRTAQLATTGCTSSRGRSGCGVAASTLTSAPWMRWRSTIPGLARDSRTPWATLSR